MLSSTMLSIVTLALSHFPLFSHCSPLLDPHRDKAGAEHKRNNNLATQMQVVISSPTTTPTITTVPVTSTPLVVTATSASVYFIPPDAFPTRQASSQAPTAPPQPAPSQPQAAVSGPAVPLVMAYYPDWASFDPEKIDFKRFDWIDFAFAVPDRNFNIKWDDPKAPEMLRRLVSAAHAGSKKAKLSIGGWSGSKFFSQAVSTSDSRQTFVNNILSVYNEFNVDGIDIDWEYPGQTGESGNVVTPDDSKNFLLFLKLLKLTLPLGARITAATQSQPFAGPDGDPMSDVSAFADVLDWILLMNYDVWGSSSAPGPNAPLYDRCHNSTQPEASALAGYTAWTTAGFPASQIVLGLPSYGYISKSTSSSLRQRSMAHLLSGRPRPRPIAHASESHATIVQVINDDGGGEDGAQVQFNELVAQGVLIRNEPDTNEVMYTSSGGFMRYWDDCSSTPFLRSESIRQIITYDDPLSLGMKAEFAVRVGMLGVNMFDVHGDSAQWDLTDSVRRNLGLPHVLQSA